MWCVCVGGEGGGGGGRRAKGIGEHSRRGMDHRSGNPRTSVHTDTGREESQTGKPDIQIEPWATQVNTLMCIPDSVLSVE